MLRLHWLRVNRGQYVVKRSSERIPRKFCSASYAVMFFKKHRPIKKGPGQENLINISVRSDVI